MSYRGTGYCRESFGSLLIFFSTSLCSPNQSIASPVEIASMMSHEPMTIGLMPGSSAS